MEANLTGEPSDASAESHLIASLERLVLDQLPVAMEFLGRPFEEATLFEIASAYEAGTKHRRVPKGFGPLKGEP